MENNDIEDLYDINKENNIKNMRKNGTYGGTTEVQVYSIISKLKIICFMRNLQEINDFKADDSDPINCFISGKNNNTEIYIMINIKNKESLNHYVPLKNKTKCLIPNQHLITIKDFHN